jgi:hypothetical protein
MDLEQIFSAATFVAVLGWLVMIFIPRNPYAKLLGGVVAPLVLSVGYLILIFQHLQGAQGGFGSLADVAALFQKPELLLAGWIHYLAFDLFIGGWEIRDSQRNGIPHLLVIPSLLMTFMLGPIGLLFYFAIRAAKTRTLSLNEGGDHA